MDAIKVKIRGLHISPADRRVGKFWKKLKTSFKDKDLIQMQSQIHSHFLILSLHLNVSHVQTVHMSASPSQLSEITAVLHQIKDQVSHLTAGLSPATAVTQAIPLPVDRTATSNHLEAPTVRLELEQCIAGLVESIGGEEDIIETDDARHMIKDLEALLQSAEGTESEAGNCHCDADCHEPASDVSRELEIVRNVLISAPKIAINSTSSPQAISESGPGVMLRQDRKRKVIEMTGGNLLTLHANRRTKQPRDNSGCERTRDFAAKVVFQLPGKKSNLVISVNQTQINPSSYLTIIPKLAVHNIVANDSPIFALAAEGNIQAILDLIGSGPLTSIFVQHGARAGQIGICEFAIKYGFDIDEIAANGGIGETTPLHLAADRADPGRVFKALLQAGADPTLGISRYIPVIFILSRDLTDWHDSLAFLINRGAVVNAEDNHGYSVSHIAYSQTCHVKFERNWSFPGDLWDAVLDTCGYGVQDFRNGYPRSAKYTDTYTRDDFESLWKGREERCPYWNDEFWVSPMDDGKCRAAFQTLCLCEFGCVYKEYFDEWESDSISTDQLTDMEVDREQPQDDKSDGFMAGRQSLANITPGRYVERGGFPPRAARGQDNVATMDDLIARCDITIEVLKSITPEDIEGKEDEGIETVFSNFEGAGCAVRESRLSGGVCGG
ncbi:hypothetical protein OQA88_13364 [Cercophora sp. LCS_1]